MGKEIEMGTGNGDEALIPDNVNWYYVFYDIPTVNHKLYWRVFNLLWAHAAPVQMSVWAVAAGHKELVRTLLEEARQETGQYGVISFTAVHPASDEELKRMVAISLRRLCGEIAVSLRTKINEAQEDGKFLSGAYLNSIGKKLKGIYRVAMVFALMNDLQALYDAANELWSVQHLSLQERRAQQRAEKRATKQRALLDARQRRLFSEEEMSRNGEAPEEQQDQRQDERRVQGEGQVADSGRALEGAGNEAVR